MPLIAYQIISYFVSFGIYMLIFNWKLATVLTVGVGFHEYGHLLAAGFFKMKTKGCFLIPFIGGISLIALPYKKYSHKAYIALAGPMAGMLLTYLCYGLFLITHAPILASITFLMAVFNVFNLIPLSFMDGAQ